jgi:cutinase
MLSRYVTALFIEPHHRECRSDKSKYPATLKMPYSAAKGIDDTIHRLNGQNKACPDQKFALVGYSQGGRVIHGALAASGAIVEGLENPRPKLDQSVIPKILAIVLFGDAGFKATSRAGDTQNSPEIPTALQSKVKQNCVPGDPVTTHANQS